MALTVADRYTAVEGPKKRETIHVVSDAAVASATVDSNLANPEYVTIQGTNDTILAADTSANVSGKTITVTQPNDAETYALTVFGF